MHLRAMRGIGRLTFVTILAVAVFGIALVSFRDLPPEECQMDWKPDPSYSIRIEEPPEVNLTTYHLLVTRNNQPVRGALVCMRADMGGLGHMSGMAASNLATEVAPGRYEVPIRLEMSGFWQGQIVVQEPNRPATGKKLNIRVR